TLALLPAENATGNFVKVVQRLTVRIEILDYDPDQAPLFIGLSVTPRVHLNREPTGPDAGRLQQAYLPMARASASTPQPCPPQRSASRSRDARSAPGWSRWRSCSRPSWRSSTPRSRTWRCATSPAVSPRRSPTASG